VVVLGVEVRLLSRSFPVPIVSVELGYRLCAVSNAELLGRIMLDYKVGGFGLTCAWQAPVVWLLSCWRFALCVLPGIGGRWGAWYSYVEVPGGDEQRCVFWLGGCVYVCGK
jgi:hypothetical protein